MKREDILQSRPRLQSTLGPRSATEPVRRVVADRARSYEVRWQPDLAALRSALAAAVGERRALLITTPSVEELYTREVQSDLNERGLEVEMLTLPLTESTKAWPAVETVCRHAQRFALEREGLLVSVGGGVCSDVTTVAASMIRRGVGHIRVPTTLLAQVDAGVGIKGGINFNGQKNYLGCFYPAEVALVCPEVLPTVPVRHLHAGMAEVAKVAIANDPELFRLLERDAEQLLEQRFAGAPERTREILWRSITGILEALEPNLYEDQTYVRTMDLGHTFSPSLETASSYELCHGEAVAVDIALSACLARQLGWTSDADCCRILDLLHKLGLPTHSAWLSTELMTRSVSEATKHRGGRLNLFVPIGIGASRSVQSEDLQANMLSRALAECVERSSAK